MNSRNEEPGNQGWIDGLRSQDPRVVAELRQYLCRSLLVALSGKPGQSDVEDFAQQALQKILNSLHRFRGDSRFTTWATAIAIRVALSELRRKRWGEVSLDELLQQGRGVEHVSLSQSGENAARGEILEALQAAIRDSLTERQRAIILAELRGMPTDVLSDQLGMSRGAIYKMHHDARKKLRRSLEAQGFGVEDLRFALKGVAKA